MLPAIGRRGTPRKLEVPGEELPKVVYRLIDPEQYRNQHVLVVSVGGVLPTPLLKEIGVMVETKYGTA